MQRWLGPIAVVVGMLAAGPATAHANGWVCEASALRAQVLDAPAVEPATANQGSDDCKQASGGGGVTPALPIGVRATALTATTALDGPVAPAADQTARAQGIVSGVAISSLPSLPVALPQPDFSGLSAVTVPGVGTLDLRPALQALIPPRALPNVDLLSVGAAQSQASAQCVNGIPQFRGSSSLATVAINGVEIGVDQAVSQTVQLIDSDSIDPSDVDLSTVVGPPGVDLTPLQGLIQPVLDQLPDIAVPATLARVRLTPNERVETGTRLTQRALHAFVSIAGQRIADTVIGESTVGTDGVSCGGVADLALRCQTRKLVLIDVFERRDKVQLLGAADRKYVGKRVRIRLMATGRTVARPKVRKDGTFRASAPLPAEKIRDTSKARYEASRGRERSMRLKLHRRMLVKSMRSRGGRITIVGQVVQPLAAPVRTVVVKRRVSCKDWKVVKRFTPRSDGAFSVKLPAPHSGEAAAYRMTTRVKHSAIGKKTYPTFTLPRYVDLG
jgi:hypothetical protein